MALSWLKSHELFMKFVLGMLIPMLMGVMFLSLGKSFSKLDSITNDKILDLFSFIFVSHSMTLYCSYLYGSIKCKIVFIQMNVNLNQYKNNSNLHYFLAVHSTSA